MGEDTKTEWMTSSETIDFVVWLIPSLGLEEGVHAITRTFAVQLRRLSDEFDLSERAGELLRTATERLRAP